MPPRQNKKKEQKKSTEEPKNIKRRFVETSRISRCLQCSICTDVFDDPVHPPCQHVFCRTCLTQWADNHRAAHVPCPWCRQHFHMKDLVRNNLAYNMINELQIFCFNRGCEWSGPLQEIQIHIDKCAWRAEQMPKWFNDYLKSRENEFQKQEDQVDQNEDACIRDAKAMEQNLPLSVRLFKQAKDNQKDVSQLQKLIAKDAKDNNNNNNEEQSEANRPTGRVAKKTSARNGTADVRQMAIELGIPLVSQDNDDDNNENNHNEHRNNNESSAFSRPEELKLDQDFMNDLGDLNQVSEEEQELDIHQAFRDQNNNTNQPAVSLHDMMPRSNLVNCNELQGSNQNSTAGNPTQVTTDPFGIVQNDYLQGDLLVSREGVQTLIGMGFEEEMAVQALTLHQNDMTMALEHCLNNQIQTSQVGQKRRGRPAGSKNKQNNR